MKRLILLCTALLALGVVQVFTDGSGRQVLRVPDDFATIQQAVDTAVPGDVIMVAPGTYCEQVIITTDDLTLRTAPGNPAILRGDCETGGFGLRAKGIFVQDVSGVEISGFIIEGFATGIGLQAASGSRVFGNEIRDNVYLGLTPLAADAVGIMLGRSSFNEIQQNWIHDNGHLGIGLLNGSNSNLIRANRLIDNQAQQATYPGFACALMLWGSTNSDNWIVENEITNSLSVGGSAIMIGGGVQIGNVVGQNRVHGHRGEGIKVMSGSYDNVIEQNNATGNGLNNGGVDLKDWSTIPNLWQRNLGTCEPGNAGCD
jgi:parallel beta-helix repeat protein